MSGMEIAVVGAGAIGRAHAAQLAQRPGEARLGAIVDPALGAKEFAAGLGAPWFADLESMSLAPRPAGAIIAAPNDLHLPLVRACLAAKIPVLVEKPIASTVEEALAIGAAGRAAGLPVLVGHHRRHNPILKAARAFLNEGRLGRLLNVTVLAQFLKPDPYFAFDWRRRRPGGGPILINLIHEIDVVRHLCGEIASVRAIASSAARGFEVEDTAAVLLRLASGALVTLSLSDASAAPWNWDLIARESAHYPPQPARANSHFFSGTEGALTLPHLEFWSYRTARGWHEPMSVEALPFAPGDPYLAQIAHFCAVIRGAEAPLIDADDATRTLSATLAVKASAESGETQNLDP